MTGAPQMRNGDTLPLGGIKCHVLITASHVKTSPQPQRRVLIPGNGTLRSRIENSIQKENVRGCVQ